MKRYILFGYDGYYPRGGWNDFIASFDTVAEAFDAIRRDYFQIVDLTTGKIVREGKL